MSSCDGRDNEAAPGIPVYETGRWGTYTMGIPSNPAAHPENRQAATWEPFAHGNLGASAHFSTTHTHAKACQQTPASSTSAYVDPRVPTNGNPYVATTPLPKDAGKSPVEIISDYLNRWSKKIEEISKKAGTMVGNVWQHLRIGQNMADTAWGRVTQGTKLLSEGGYENVFKQTFESSPEEKLQKAYACYLSTSAGPVAGTLYISTEKIAFCSDRPLSYAPQPGYTAWTYYKIVVPLHSLQAVNPSGNQNNPAEKYIQTVTADNHEFWFMGFLNYDKAVNCLQEAVRLRS